MLRNASTINGYTIAASDGRIGTVSDFLFDDASWSILWLVVDTGTWLSGRKVLLPVSVLGHSDTEEHEFSVRLTMQQIEDSPDIATHRPVSRQMETNIYEYFGGMGGPTVPYPGARRIDQVIADTQDDGDPHLRSIEAVTGYHIHATDGEIGHIEDFLVEEADWSIHYLVIDTKNWWPGRKVLISPRSAREIDWPTKRVNLDVDRQRVKDSPAYDPSMTVDGTYEEQFHLHYHAGRPSNPA